MDISSPESFLGSNICSGAASASPAFLVRAGGDRGSACGWPRVAEANGYARRASREERSRADAGEALVGDGPRMRALRGKIELVASARSPVLICGESGTGKEVVARIIHERGPRRSKPFIAVNAAAIPEQLLESELFGHVRGAYTGAFTARRGLLAEADGGTLLLDEIGDMPLGLQAKLLRVLQVGEVRTVGEDRSHRVDVRIIAATHRDLPAFIRTGRFREDLYFRLNVLPLVTPPLREHPEDIPLLARHFLARALLRLPSSAVRSISRAALAELGRCSWPGNVRELESTMERLVVLVKEEVILPHHVYEAAPMPSVTGPSWPRGAAGEPLSLKQLTDAYVQWVLAEHAGNKARAAELLGVNLSTLYRWQHSKTHS